MAHTHCIGPDFQATFKSVGFSGVPFSTRRAGISCGRCRANSGQDEQPYKSSPPSSSVPRHLIPTEIVTLKESNQDAGESSQEQGPLTVYSLRFSTGVRRGSSMSDPLSYVWVCLVGEDGKSFLNRISPLFDPEEEGKKLQTICENAGVAAGANCDLALKSSGSKASGSSSVSQRFLQGDVDEVSFLGPEIGQITALIVGPESGSWNLDEVTVTSSRTDQTTLFVCRDMLGGRSKDGAAFLTPVPLNTVQYGSGASGVFLTKGQAATVREENMKKYQGFKMQLLLTTAGLVVGGGAFAAIVGGKDVAVPYAFGGSIGLLYQWLLQKGVDSVKVKPEMMKPSDSLSALADEVVRSSQESSLQKIVGSQFFRLGVVFSAAALSFFVLQSIGPVDSVNSSEAVDKYTRMQQIIAAGLGFYMYKFAVFGVTLSNDMSKDDVMQSK